MSYQNKDIFLSFCTVLGSFLIQLTLGGAYSYSVLLPFFKNGNYSAIASSNDLETIYSLMDVFRVAMFGLSTSMSFGGYMAAKFNPKKILFVGCLLMNTGIMLTMLTVFDNWKILTYGFICGFGAGLIYSVSLAVSSQWFPGYEGTVIGIVISGFSMGQILVFFITKIEILKNHKSYVFLMCGSIYLSIQLIGTFLIRKPRNFDEAASVPNTVNEALIDVPPHHLICEFDFWVIWLIFALNSVGTILIIQLHQIIEYINKIPCVNNNSTIFLYGFSSFFGRIIWGFLSDHISMRTIFTTLSMGSCFLYAISILLFQIHFSDFTATDTLSLFENFPSVYEGLIFICCGWLSGNLSLIPALVVKRFGQKYFARNFGFIWTSYSFAGILTGSVVVLMARRMTITLISLSVMSFLSFLLTLFYRDTTAMYFRNFYDIFMYCYN